MLMAAVAVSVSLAVSAPDSREPSAASSNTVAHKKQFEAKGSQRNGHGGGGQLSSGGPLSGLGLFSLPKKLLGAVTGAVGGLLKFLGEKNLLRTAKLAALVAILGTVATVGAVAIAGLVSAVSAICGVVLYVKYLLGAGNGYAASDSVDSHIDNVSDFVTGAFNKYEHYRAQ